MKRIKLPVTDPGDDIDTTDSDNMSDSFTQEDEGTIPTPVQTVIPNPDILKRDPMAEIFGPGSTVKMVGDENDEMPDEIRGVIEENGLAKRDFMCTLKSIPAGSLNDNVDASSSSVYVKAWKRSIPSLDFIAREYGPGQYILALSWRSVNREEGVSKQHREIVPISISDKCAAEHKKYMLDKKIAEASDTGTKVRDAIVDKTIEGQLISALTGKQENEKKQSPKEYLEELMGTVKMLGLPVGGFGAAPVTPKIEWEKLLPAVATIATSVIALVQSSSQRKSDEQNKLFMMMLAQNQSSSSQVIEMYKSMATKPPVDNPLKELQQMVMSAMDIKEMMNPAKETLSDKVFKIVEMVAPQILSIAATAAQRNQPPTGLPVDMAKMYVKANPDFDKLKKDPAEMMKFVSRLDDHIGWENADMVLAVVEWERPATCTRDPLKRYPPQQNTSTNDDIEEGEITEA